MKGFHPLLHSITPSNHLPLDTWLKSASEERIFPFAALPKGCAAANDRVFWLCNRYLAVLSTQYNTTSIDFLSNFLLFCRWTLWLGDFWLFHWDFKRLCHSIRLLHFHSAVKIQPFSPVFLLTEYRARAFSRLIIWNFKKKASTVSYGTASC